MGLLNKSIRIKNLELKNRLVMPPMAISKADENGKATTKTFDYYKEKSAGGYIGLIITEHSYVSQEGKASKGQLSIADDGAIAGLQQLASLIHKNNTNAIAQLSHAGGATTMAVTGLEQLSVSAVKMPRGSLTAPHGNGPLPKEMSLTDIKKVVDDFTKAALRAKAAGFDGVEIHSAHGYLLNQFYSPLTNKRVDEYTGNTIDGRIKLHLEIIQSISREVGESYPIGLRLGACDYIEGGSTIEDSVLAVKKFEKAGLDFIDISGGFCGYINPVSSEQGYFGELTKIIKQQVSIPVILTGGIVDAKAAEKLLLEEKADLIGVGRAILRDSSWPKEAIETASAT